MALRIKGKRGSCPLGSEKDDKENTWRSFKSSNNSTSTMGNIMNKICHVDSQKTLRTVSGIGQDSFSFTGDFDRFGSMTLRTITNNFNFQSFKNDKSRSKTTENCQNEEESSIKRVVDEDDRKKLKELPSDKEIKGIIVRNTAISDFATISRYPKLIDLDLSFNRISSSSFLPISIHERHKFHSKWILFSFHFSIL